MPELLIECDYCGGVDLRFSWRRVFTVRSNGWDGVHEYWLCLGCGRGCFRISEGKVGEELGGDVCFGI